MKKITKLYQEKSLKELEKESQLIRQEIAKLRLSLKTSPQKNTNLLIKKRKQLAVLLTVSTEKKEIESFRPKVDKKP
jgi:ribosomal protein L29